MAALKVIFHNTLSSEGPKSKVIGPFARLEVRHYPTWRENGPEAQYFDLALVGDGEVVARLGRVSNWWEDQRGISWPQLEIKPLGGGTVTPEQQEIAWLRAALQRIADSGEVGPEAASPMDDISGWDNSGDIFNHGYECGVNSMANIARAALEGEQP